MLSKVLIVALAIGAASAGPFNRLAELTDGRIVGGVEAAPHSFPWQVALLSRVGAATAFCGGSVVSANHVLTAAHCCAGQAASSIKVRAGAHDLRVNEAGAVTVNVARISIHPAYNDDTMDNDFCVLTLASSLPLSATLQAVALPTAADGAAGQVCTVTGWGNDVQGNGPAQNARALHSRLRRVEVTVVDNAACHKKYTSSVYPVSITQTMVCGSAPGKDSCQGDSGGPFVCRANASSAYKLVGVVSWGYGCADARYPGVYARTAVAVNWVNGIISA